MSNLQTHYHFKLDFQKVDQHTGGKWLIGWCDYPVPIIRIVCLDCNTNVTDTDWNCLLPEKAIYEK